MSPPLKVNTMEVEWLIKITRSRGIRHNITIFQGLFCILHNDLSQIVGNKGEIILEFSLKITQFDFTKRGGRDEEWTKSLS